MGAQVRYGAAGFEAQQVARVSGRSEEHVLAPVLRGAGVGLHELRHAAALGVAGKGAVELARQVVEGVEFGRG